MGVSGSKGRQYKTFDRAKFVMHRNEMTRNRYTVKNKNYEKCYTQRIDVCGIKGRQYKMSD